MTVAEARAAGMVAREATGAAAAIEHYGVIGDCRSAALVSDRGSIDWLCWPRFDSPPLFSRLLDSRGGSFSIEPLVPYEAQRAYAPHSNSIVTHFQTAGGSLRVTDALFADAEPAKRRELLPQSMLIRRLEASGGDVDVRVLCKPTRGFGHETLKLRRRGPGSFTFPVEDGAGHLAADFDLEAVDGAIGAACTVRPGEPRTVILSWNENAPAVFPPLAESLRLVEATDRYWQTWAGRITYDGPYADYVERSALALKLMTYSPSGAIVAAPTSSLPEKLGQHYNWDYRFCWLRDASFTIRALYGLGLHEEARAFLAWLLHTTHLTLPRLQVMYSVFGKKLLPERELWQLEGYEASRPVRVGNQAYIQEQLDIYGEVMNAAVMSREEGAQFSSDERKFLERLASYVMRHWHEPDSGIWESRTDFSRHVHSRVLCWVAMDSAARLARDGVLRLDASECQRMASAIKDEVNQLGVSAAGHYVASYENPTVDSALLTLPLLGYEDVNSPRIQATIAAVRRGLGRDDLLYRHPRGETRGEGAFVLCSFWLVECLVMSGEVDGARELFEGLLARANDLGLYAEEIDPETGAFLGNFPQAFSHVGLINAALALEGATRQYRGTE
jgi:GH15 family glucan-1,4-alpha-glucosidase